jgi:hypothetical protein
MKPTWLNEAIYRDVTLADAKAVFSMSLAALGVAGAASFFGSMPDPERRAIALNDWWVFWLMVAGVVLAVFAILAAAATVLPRRYVTRHKDPKGANRLTDAWHTMVPWSLGARGDGGSERIDELYSFVSTATPDAGTARNEDNWPTPSALIEEIGRLAEVRRRKYWWVGASIGLSTAGVIIMIMGVGRAVLVINRDAEKSMTVHTLVSGGQTGADRAALDFASEAGFDHSGFVPKGRTDEDGILPDRYSGLREAPSADPAIRTTLNVCASEGTVVFARAPLVGGSALTAEVAAALERPLLHIDPGAVSPSEAAARLNRWIANHRIGVLNVAGSRRSEDTRIYEETLNVLRLAFSGKR